MGNRMRSRAAMHVLIVLGLLAAACGSGDESSEPDPQPTSAEVAPTTEAAVEPEPAATPEPDPTATEAPLPTVPPEATPTPEPEQAGLPDTPAAVVVSEVYDFAGGVPDAALLPAPAGAVTARWYRAGTVYAVVYEGLDPTVDACPGNSVLTEAGFEHVSNAELPNAACPDFATRIDNSASQGVQLCAGQVGYLTLIPAEVVGRFFASIETPVPELGGVGLTSNVVIDDPATVPEIDPAALSC